MSTMPSSGPRPIARRTQLPAPPAMPLSRMISLESGAFCPECGSTMMRKRWILFGARPGCIHPECWNYGGARNGAMLLLSSRASASRDLWIVGQFRAQTPQGSVWDFQGTFSTRERAVAVCASANYFIAPCRLDQPLPDELQTWPGVEYPIAEAPAP
ncbi:hypothetical protein ABWU93_11410 [Xanthomonas translucens pv. translucens]|uniref:hypothetical protein n=1 Tax=Xanthomonas campestris pv. translucens TaxID=343 RepID=UPI003F6F1334